MASQCPVGPATVDFDHHSPALVLSHLDTYRALRSENPVAWSPHYGGFWVVSRYEDVMRLTNDPEAFLSSKTYDDAGEAQGGSTIPPFHLWACPTETDKPEWMRYRTALAPLFTPGPVEAKREICQHFCDELIDRAIESGKIDLVADLVNPLPSLMTMYTLGIPLEQWQLFTVPFHKGAYSLPGTPEAEEARKGVEWFLAYLWEQILSQRSEPRPGLISTLMETDVIREGRLGSGPRLNDREIFTLCVQVAMGGVDTTTALTSNSLLYINSDDTARQQLIDNPALLPTACEEFMRLASPIQGLARTAARDMELGGQQIKAGDRLLFMFASANRDPAQFDDPDTIKLDRMPNRHLGFGIGIHRCIGSTFARMMFSVMMATILRRMPDYRIDETAMKHYPVMGHTNGWISMPATFTPGPRVGREAIIPAWKDALDFGDPSMTGGVSMAAVLAG